MRRTERIRADRLTTRDELLDERRYCKVCEVVIDGNLVRVRIRTSEGIVPRVFGVADQVRVMGPDDAQLELGAA